MNNTVMSAVLSPSKRLGITRLQEGRVYQKPRVERFGTFRELTQVGFNGTTDGFTICGANGGTGDELCGGPGAPPCRDGSPVSST
ncbi:MAG: lasso RiPP family leader peptide-containing protein [Gemmatimonadaceae bacterium]|nr:lasso RiPP family leader peptide-containing protein [Gemmatimonadaceae bacterium]